MKLMKLYKKIGNQQIGVMRKTEAKVFIEDSNREYIITGVKYDKGEIVGFNASLVDGFKISTINDLIQNKDYDYISIRATLPDDSKQFDTFIGCCCSENGKLVSIDDDTYSEDMEVISYEEWDNPMLNIRHGLTVTIPGRWNYAAKYK